MSPPKVKIIRLQRGKANAIDGDLLETLGNELDRAPAEGASAVVITGTDRFFSAGLDLKGLPDQHQGLEAFVEAFDNGLLRLWSYPLPTVAAVNGHAVAGGCVLACACDVRLGAEGDYRIGLSEVDVGVPFPTSALEIVRQAIASDWLTELVLGARLVSPGEAQRAGILHQVVAPDALLAEAVAHAERLGAKPQPAYNLTKSALRADALRRIASRAREDRSQFIAAWFSEDTVRRRKAMLRG